METRGSGITLGRVTAIVLNIALISLGIFVLFNQQWTVDEIGLVGYRPSAAVVSLAHNTTMTPLAERYFYVSHPTIDERSTFAKDCGNNDEKTIILGCYNGRNIYVFDVNDPRLPDVKEVTAAHEMLHAAYTRLSSSDKANVNRMVEAALKTIDDKHVKDLIDAYNRTEPGQLDNEMHSILGTEVGKLPPDLEAYYSRYFADRSKVVSYAQHYQAVFTDLQNQQESLLGDLNSLADKINSQTTKLNDQLSQFNSDVTAFNTKAESGGFATQDEFNTARAGLVARQQQLQTERDGIQSLIDEYDAKRQELQDLNFEASSLERSINSQLPAVPSV